MARKSGIWWHKSRKCWYTPHGGKNQRLDPNKKTAELMWAKLVGKPTAKGDELLVEQVLARLLGLERGKPCRQHAQAHPSVDLSFADSLPPATCIGDLEPRHLTQWLDKRCPKRPKNGEKPTSDNTRHNYAGDVLAAFNWATSANQRILPLFAVDGLPQSTEDAPRALPGTGANGRLALADRRPGVSGLSDRDPPHRLPAAGGPCAGGQVRALERGRRPYPEGVGQRKTEGTSGSAGPGSTGHPQAAGIRDPEGPLLRNTPRATVDQGRIDGRFQRLKDKVPYRSDGLRHAAHLHRRSLKNGASETAIAEVVGHEDKTMIQKVYGHPSLHQDLLKGVVKKANRRAAGGKGVDPRSPAE